MPTRKRNFSTRGGPNPNPNPDPAYFHPRFSVFPRRVYGALGEDAGRSSWESLTEAGPIFQQTYFEISPGGDWTFTGPTDEDPDPDPDPYHDDETIVVDEEEEEGEGGGDRGPEYNIDAAVRELCNLFKRKIPRSEVACVPPITTASEIELFNRMAKKCVQDFDLYDYLLHLIGNDGITDPDYVTKSIEETKRFDLVEPEMIRYLAEEIIRFFNRANRMNCSTSLINNESIWEVIWKFPYCFTTPVHFLAHKANREGYSLQHPVVEMTKLRVYLNVFVIVDEDMIDRRGMIAGFRKHHQE